MFPYHLIFLVLKNIQEKKTLAEKNAENRKREAIGGRQSSNCNRCHKADSRHRLPEHSISSALGLLPPEFKATVKPQLRCKRACEIPRAEQPFGRSVGRKGDGLVFGDWEFPNSRGKGAALLKNAKLPRKDGVRDFAVADSNLWGMLDTLKP
jgi:hypothetical protein